MRAFSFVGRSVTIYGFCPLAARPHLSPPTTPDAERERQGQVALYLLRMHIRYP